MKILTDKDWSLEKVTDEGFLFKNLKFGDLLIVKNAKYVLKHLNVVIFCVCQTCGLSVENNLSLSRASHIRLTEETSLSRDSEIEEIIERKDDLTVEDVHKLSTR